MTSFRPLKIFLCYASSDRPSVLTLYRYLKDHKMDPWLDAVNLMPGQNWQVEIPNAIHSSDVVIVCLTKNSIDKEGYIQKEIKFALDKALEMPDEHVFLIPAKLEECEVPNSLSKYQWVNLYEKNDYTRLLKSLRLRGQQLSSSELKKDGDVSIYLNQEFTLPNNNQGVNSQVINNKTTNIHRNTKEEGQPFFKAALWVGGLMSLVIFALFVCTALGVVVFPQLYNNLFPKETPPAGISNIYMASDENGTQKATTFAPTDDIYVFFDINQVDSGTSFVIKWYALNVEGQDPSTPFTTSDYSYNGESTLYANISSTDPSGFPVAQYKVEIYMDSVKVGEQQFSVQ